MTILRTLPDRRPAAVVLAAAVQCLHQLSDEGRYDRYGFRVPAVVVCPYAKRDYVSSTPFDHTSALKLIEEKWNLPPLTRRDASALAPWDLINFSAPPPFLHPPTLPPPPPTIPWSP